jgi:hypothetical protein
MKEPLRFKSNETGEVKYIHGLKDFINDIYMPNMEYQGEYFNKRIAEVTSDMNKAIKKANRKTFWLCAVMFVAGMVVTAKKHADLEDKMTLKINRLEEEIRDIDDLK